MDLLELLYARTIFFFFFLNFFFCPGTGCKLNIVWQRDWLISGLLARSADRLLGSLVDRSVGWLFSRQKVSHSSYCSCVSVLRCLQCWRHSGWIFRQYRANMGSWWWVVRRFYGSATSNIRTIPSWSWTSLSITASHLAIVLVMLSISWSFCLFIYFVIVQFAKVSTVRHCLFCWIWSFYFTCSW